MDLWGWVKVGDLVPFGDSEAHRQYPGMYGVYTLQANEVYGKRIYKQIHTTDPTEPSKYFLVFCKEGR